MNWSWLMALICPLMMILMMFGMRGQRHKGTQENQTSQKE
ncbi:DUF2933 domain-containing protein [Paenibacillus segetis]|jgi:hypothetical protein|uniref:DUF2933 domain-containing protein n=1 Tax=Paenibacillus segetis TaxID=1325360 RepID=A0ABQ1YD36_9BACL|nr:DUF2933 domain-containing protein [Paenibacillus segetis]GGH21683.1 hypothetical protein GCM10008013_19720 [Paenibacillus segetis]